MGGLSRQPGRTPRRAREQRAYRLAVIGGTAGAVAVVTFVLAIVGVLSFGIPLITAAVAAICGFLFKRTVGS
jgi:putative flippase GtrA